MNTILIRTFEIIDIHSKLDDPDMDGDPVTELWEGKKRITRGDYYHDKIDQYIDGFLDGLRYMNVQVVVTRKKIANEKRYGQG